MTDNLGFVSPYLQTKPRSRVQAAFDLCPELAQAIETLDYITRHVKSMAELIQGLKDAEEILAVLRSIQHSPEDPQRDQWEGE